MASALTAQKGFLNVKNIVNLKVKIREDMKQYQNTRSYASSKVDYSMGENIYMLPSNKNIDIKLRTVGYNNKILIPDSTFSLGKNDKVKTSAPSNKATIVHTPKTYYSSN